MVIIMTNDDERKNFFLCWWWIILPDNDDYNNDNEKKIETCKFGAFETNYRMNFVVLFPGKLFLFEKIPVSGTFSLFLKKIQFFKIFSSKNGMLTAYFDKCLFLRIVFQPNDENFSQTNLFLVIHNDGVFWYAVQSSLSLSLSLSLRIPGIIIMMMIPVNDLSLVTTNLVIRKNIIRAIYSLCSSY